jgi:hypothetical protein
MYQFPSNLITKLIRFSYLLTFISIHGDTFWDILLLNNKWCVDNVGNYNNTNAVL